MKTLSEIPGIENLIAKLNDEMGATCSSNDLFKALSPELYREMESVLIYIIQNSSLFNAGLDDLSKLLIGLLESTIALLRGDESKPTNADIILAFLFFRVGRITHLKK